MFVHLYLPSNPDSRDLMLFSKKIGLPHMGLRPPQSAGWCGLPSPTRSPLCIWLGPSGRCGGVGTDFVCVLQSMGVEAVRDCEQASSISCIPLHNSSPRLHPDPAPILHSLPKFVLHLSALALQPTPPTTDPRPSNHLQPTTSPTSPTSPTYHPSHLHPRNGLASEPANSSASLLSNLCCVHAQNWRQFDAWSGRDGKHRNDQVDFGEAEDGAQRQGAVGQGRG
jgi:hypothetical protein